MKTINRLLLTAYTPDALNIGIEDTKSRGYQIALVLNKEIHDIITWYGVIMQKEYNLLKFSEKILFCIKTGNVCFKEGSTFSIKNN